MGGGGGGELELCIYQLYDKIKRLQIATNISGKNTRSKHRSINEINLLSLF